MKKIFSLAIIAILTVAAWFESVSATYTKTLETDIKVYALYKKVEAKINSIENQDTREKIKLRVAEKIEKVLWMSGDEIFESAPLSQKEFGSLKEYVYKIIYRLVALDEWADAWIWGVPRIIENDFAKAVVFEYNWNLGSIKKTSNTFYYDDLEKTDAKNSIVEFFEIPTGVKVEDYIQQKFIDKKFVWKCRVEKQIANWTYQIKAFGDHQKIIDEAFWTDEIWDDDSCWDYQFWSFTALSKKVLMFEAMRQEGRVIDIPSIELKK